jgi:hypothetical protein
MSGNQPEAIMAKRSKLLLAAILLVALPACSPTDERSGGGMIPSAQASESTQPLWPAPGADADPGGQVHEYY